MAQNGTQLSLTHPLLTEAIDTIQNNPSTIIDFTISDFDNTQYHLLYQDNTLQISILLNGFQELEPYLDLSKYTVETPKSGFNLTLTIPSEHYTDAPQIKALLVGQAAYNIYKQQKTVTYPTMSSFLNKDLSQAGEFIYLQGQDRLTVIFKILFEDANDDGFAKVFIQELIDARKLSQLQRAPQVLYSKTPPMELNAPSSGQGNCAYVTFVVFPQHFESQPVLQLAKLLLFRNYLQYHIKCSKAYLHTRMRSKVNDFLKVLNRAKLQ